MYRFCLAFVAVLFFLGLLSPSAFAVGNVLVPSDDSDSISSVPPNAPPAVTKNLPKNDEASHPALLPKTGNTSSKGSVGTQGYTPIPSSLKPPSGPVISKPPTQIIKIPTMNPAGNVTNAGLPNSLSIGMKDYFWGPNDVAMVNRSLSIPPDQVSKRCRLTTVDTLTSDTGGGYITDLGQAQGSQAVLRYSGKPSSITVQARALCDMAPLPPNSGIVFQIGDKYAVFITQLQCPPPPADIRGLSFQYAGNGKAQCLYQ